MSLSPPTPPSRSLQILKTTLYILAGLVLILGLIAGVSLTAGATNMVANALLPIQFLGGGAIFNFIAPMLTGSLINLGIAILIFTKMIYCSMFGGDIKPAIFMDPTSLM